MAKKLETMLLVTSLKKAAKKSEAKVWEDIAERMLAPSRAKVAVNVDKVSKIAGANKGKTIIVLGKILSDGEMENKASVVAVNASEGAAKKINANGSFVKLAEFAKTADKVKADSVVLVK